MRPPRPEAPAVNDNHQAPADASTTNFLRRTWVSSTDCLSVP